MYDGIAHPDCIKLFGHTPMFSLQKYYEEFAQLLESHNMYTEQSSGIYRRCSGAELGMNKDMLSIMLKNNVKIVTVSDAHCPEDVGDSIVDLNNIIRQIRN